MPPERRVVALKSHHDRAGRRFDAGDIFESRDPLVRGNRKLFEKGGQQ